MPQHILADAIMTPAPRLRPQPPCIRTAPQPVDPEPLPTMIRLERVSKVFDTRNGSGIAAVNDVSIRIPERSITLIKGPSGSGKTTLLGIIGCMIRPTSGRVSVSNHDVTRMSDDLLAVMRRTQIGFVFQNRHLIRRASALENVMVPGLPRHRINGDLRDRARSLLARLGLGSKTHQPVEHLSGGEQQRVALARALINDPQILLADEPTAHLDSGCARSFLDLVGDFLSRGRSAIVASHDPAVCESDLFDHRIHLESGRVQ